MAIINLIGGGQLRTQATRAALADQFRMATDATASPTGTEMINGPFERWAITKWAPAEAMSLSPLAIAYITEA
jgi:hypothetical protein